MRISGLRTADGSVSNFVLIALLPLIGVLVLVVDVGLMLTARTQLQNAAAASAMAAMAAMREGGDRRSALAEANRYAAMQPVVTGGVGLEPADVQVGAFNHRTRVFTPGNGFGSAAVRVVARRRSGAPCGPVELLFGKLLGRETADVSAEAVASVRRRDFVIVQDRTVSFVDSFDEAQRADRALVHSLEAQGFPGDRVGIVSLARDVTEEAPLTAVDGGASYLVQQIDGMQVCQVSGRAGGRATGPTRESASTRRAAC